MKTVIWSVKEIAQILQIRTQSKEFDGNIAVTGDRGNGKSTVINKLFYRFKLFEPWKHQVYNRDDVISLLTEQEKSLCWDDEAINSGYKRNFASAAQQDLIKILTAYRDNYNIYASAIPNFFSLDKDLRDLYFLHLNVIERGIAVVHMPLSNRIYSQDKWDADYNKKVEARWSKKMMSKPDFKPPFHKLSTFVGYLYFNDITQRQKDLYKLIKKEKRKRAFATNIKGEEVVPFIKRVYDLLLQKKLTRDGLMQMALVEGKKFNSVQSDLNRMLKDDGRRETVSEMYWEDPKKPFHSSTTDQINSIIPSF